MVNFNELLLEYENVKKYIEHERSTTCSSPHAFALNRFLDALSQGATPLFNRLISQGNERMYLTLLETKSLRLYMRSRIGAFLYLFVALLAFLGGIVVVLLFFFGLQRQVFSTVVNRRKDAHDVNSGGRVSNIVKKSASQVSQSTEGDSDTGAADKVPPNRHSKSTSSTDTQPPQGSGSPLCAIACTIGHSLKQVFFCRRCFKAKNDDPDGGSQQHPADAGCSKIKRMLQNMSLKTMLLILLGYSMTLILMCIIGIVYVSFLRGFRRQLECASWDVFDAYFFGSNNMTFVPGGIATGWMGVVSQMKALNAMRADLSPIKRNVQASEYRLPGATRGVLDELQLTPISQQIFKHFYDPNGFAGNWNNSFDTILRTLKTAYFRHVIVSSMLTMNKFHITEDPLKAFMNGRSAVTANPTVLTLYRRFIDKLSTMQTEGPLTLEKKLIQNLNPNHTISILAQDVIQLSTKHFEYVESMSRELFWKWPNVLAQVRFMFNAYVFMLAIGLALCIGLSLMVAIVAVTFLMKRIDRAYVARLYKWAAIGFMFTASTMLVISALSALGFFVLRDSCGMMFNVLLDNGDWHYLPAKILNSSVTSDVDMHSILDTCVKRRSHGDIADIVGVRMSVERLHALTAQQLDEMRDALTTKVNTAFNPIIIMSALDYFTDVRNTAAIPPFLFSHKKVVDPVVALPKRYPDDINYVSLLNVVPNNTSIVPLANFVVLNSQSLGPLAEILQNVVIVHPVSVLRVLQALNILGKLHPKGPLTFCTPFLLSQGACKANNAKMVMVSLFQEYNHEFTSTDECPLFPPQANPVGICSNIQTQWRTPDLVELEEFFLAHNDPEKVTNLYRYVIYLVLHDYYMRRPLFLSAPCNFDTKPLAPDSDTSLTRKTDLNCSLKPFYAKYFPNLSCNVSETLTNDSCRFSDLFDAWDPYLSPIRTTFLGEIHHVNETVHKLLSVARKSTIQVLSTADAILENGNCQILGSSIDVLSQIFCGYTVSVTKSFAIGFFLASLTCFCISFISLRLRSALSSTDV